MYRRLLSELYLLNDPQLELECHLRPPYKMWAIHILSRICFLRRKAESCNGCINTYPFQSAGSTYLCKEIPFLTWTILFLIESLSPRSKYLGYVLHHDLERFPNSCRRPQQSNFPFFQVHWNRYQNLIRTV